MVFLDSETVAEHGYTGFALCGLNKNKWLSDSQRKPEASYEHPDQFRRPSRPHGHRPTDDRMSGGAEILWRLSRAARHRPDHPGGRVLFPAGPVGLRQDHAFAHHRRVRGDQRRRRADRRAGHAERAGEPAADEHGVPVLRHLSASDRGRKRGLRPAPRPPLARRKGGCGRRGVGHGRACGLWRAGQPRPVRGPAPARRPGPGADPEAQGAAAGRAAVGPGSQDARADAGRTDQAAAPGRHHLRPCHPRSGGGAGHVRPHRRHVRGADRPA